MSKALAQKTVLITGANRGIGLELARQFHENGASVIAACRRASEPLTDLGVEVFEGVDVGSDEDVAGVSDKLSGRQLDWLVNNAGILEHDSLDRLDFESIERQFKINALGPLRVSSALRGSMPRGSKIFVITSAMGSIGDNTSGGYYGYRISKAAVNMAFKSLSEDLRDDGIDGRRGFFGVDLQRQEADRYPLHHDVCGQVPEQPRLVTPGPAPDNRQPSERNVAGRD